MKWKLLVMAAVTLIVGAMGVFGAPTGPTSYSVGNSERGAIEGQGPVNINAQAGNITELVFNATAITKNWQGYFGNISGKITLDDARNWTLYDWNYANAQGYIFASRINSVTWTNIQCMKFSGNGSLYPNVTTEETIMGANAVDVDGVDETFGLAAHSTLTIGTISISANTCNSTYLYVNDTSQTNDFVEVLLTDNSSNNSVVYTTILEQDVHGFNNRTTDFELLVSENGHQNTATTPYYFWVELI